MIENAIYQRLSQFAGLYALIGGASTPRVTPHLLTQDTIYPAVTYFIVAAPRETAMGSDPGIVHGRVQVDAWGATYSSTRDVKEQVRAALQRFRGTLDGTQILDCFLQDDRDEPDELVNGIIVRRRLTEWAIHYRE